MALWLAWLCWLPQAFATIQITGGNQNVTTLYVTLNGTLTSPGPLGMWYDVFQGTTNGPLLDYGALTNSATWSVTVRHLQFGTNVVVVSTQNAAGTTESASVSLNLVATVPPTVRPRPIPAEVWWGGLSQNSQLVDPTRPWNFVQKYEDGLYIHPVNNWGGMTTAQQLQLGTLLKPFNTKFIIEASGNCPPDPTWPNHTTSRTAHGAFGVALVASEQLGFYFSMINENWGAGTIQQFAQLDPSWPMGDLVAFFTGDLSMVSSNYPVPGPYGGWGPTYQLAYQRYPYTKLAEDFSPIYFTWKSYPAISTDDLNFSPLTDTNGNPILVNGKPVSFHFNMFDLQQGMINLSQALGQTNWTFVTDDPWNNLANWSNLGQRLSNREKIRQMEDYLQSRGCSHFKTCNNDGEPGTGTNWDLAYERDSLNSMYLHQNEGGRANMYLFESWYGSKDTNGVYQGRPYTCTPETQPGSFSNLALEAIKYIKGIMDTNGTLEPLALILTQQGSRYQIQLQNNGDVACLPAILALESGSNPKISAAFTDTNGAVVTSQFKSAEGYTFARVVGTNNENNVANTLLQPGETATVGYVTFTAPTNTPASNYSLALEAYWNPQDPTGVIHSRVVVTNPPLTAISLPPSISGLTNQTINIDTTSGALPFIVADDQTPASLLVVTGASSNTNLLPNADVLLGGSGSNRTVTLIPAHNQIGTTTISLMVSDGTSSSTNTFTLSVISSTNGVIYSDAADAGVTEVPAIENLTNPTSNCGNGGSSPYVNRCVVYVFQLPNLGAVTNPFVKASFTFNDAGNNGAPDATDLYGLGRRVSSTVLTTDYYGATTTADPNTTRLQASILTGSTSVGNITTSTSGKTALLNYLNAQYAAGAGAGQYVFLRLNTAAAKTGINRATLTMAEGAAAANAGAGDNSIWPQINYTLPPNTPPTLAAISNRTLIAGQTLIVTNVATDPNVPPQPLTFSLLNPPYGATIAPESGVLGWRPTIAQSPTTNLLKVVVTDNGMPPLSATQSFSVTVKTPINPGLTNLTGNNGQLRFTVTGNAGPDYIFLTSTDLVNWTQVQVNPAAVPPFTFTDPTTNYSRCFYQVLLGP